MQFAYRFAGGLALVAGLLAATPATSQEQQAPPQDQGQRPPAQSAPQPATTDAALPTDPDPAIETPIIVSATRTAQTVDETLSPVIIIGREEIERNPASDVPNLLQQQAGIDVARTGGAGQLTSVFIRGADSNHTLVMIDGVRMNPGTIGIAAIQNISLNMVERIEVVKGPRSTLYGSDAIGGVINIITRRGQKGIQYNASVGGGSNNTKEFKLGAHNRQEDRGAGINISALDTDGIPPRTDSDAGGAYDNLSYDIHARKRVFGNSDVKLSYWRSEGTANYVDFLLSPVSQDYRNSIGTVGFDTRATDNWISKARLSQMKDKIEQNQGPDFTRTERLALDWQNDIQIGEAHLVTAGLYLSDEDVRSQVFGTGFDETLYQNAAFAQDNTRIGKHHIVAGARYNDHKTAGDHTTWNLEYGYDVLPQLRVIGAANTGFRAPDGTDLYGFGGNPDLKPETSQNTEISLRFNASSRHSAYVNAFNNNIDDLIEYVDPDGFPGPIPGENQNVGRARVRGVELGYGFQHQGLALRAGAVYQDPENLDTGTQLLRRSKESASVSVAYDRPRYKVAADVRYTGERKDFNDFGTIVTLDSYTLVNLSGDFRLTRAWTLTGRVENLFDANYTLVSGFNAPGLSAFVEIRWAMPAAALTR
ncbi:MAG: TonB-dependent receptor [Pseudomonadota bacterium]|nr:MAG: TonB-dependent receptor [Pseudomonadota bacterium]